MYSNSTLTRDWNHWLQTGVMQANFHLPARIQNEIVVGRLWVPKIVREISEEHSREARDKAEAKDLVTS